MKIKNKINSKGKRENKIGLITNKFPGIII